MRLTALLTLACAIAALVLSVLSLFAGSTKSFLQNSDMLTVYTLPKFKLEELTTDKQ